SGPSPNFSLTFDYPQPTPSPRCGSLQTQDGGGFHGILYLETCFGHVPLPLGEGGAKRRVRAGNAPSSGLSGHLLPEGEGHEPPFRLNLDTSAPRGRGTRPRHSRPVSLRLTRYNP